MSAIEAPQETDTAEFESTEFEPVTIDLPDAPSTEEVSKELESQEPVESPEEPSAEPATETADLDEALHKMAGDYGLNPASFVNSDSLREAITAIDRQAATWGKSQLEKQAPEQEPEQEQAQQPQQQVQQPAPQFEMPEQIAALEKLKESITEDDFGPEIAQTLNSVIDNTSAIAKQYESRLNERDRVLEAAVHELVRLRDQQKQFTGREAEDAAVQETRDIDTFLANTPDELAEIYGRQPLQQLTADSPQLAKRRELVAEMRALKAAWGDRFTRSQLLEKAAAILNSNQIKAAAKAAAQKEIADQAKARRSQGLQRASGKNKAASGYDKAVAFVNGFKMDLGDDDTFGGI